MENKEKMNMNNVPRNYQVKKMGAKGGMSRAEQGPSGQV